MFLGIDICSTARLRKALERSLFLRDEVFSAAEVEYCAGARAPEQHLAGRWAAKEVRRNSTSRGAGPPRRPASRRWGSACWATT